MVNIFVAEMFRREIRIKFLDRFTFENGIEIDVVTAFVQDFIFAQCVAQSACQMFAK